MKTINLLSVTVLLMLLFLLSCRQSDEISNPPTVNSLAEATVTSFDEPKDPPKDPPKDVPKDRDNWRSATNENVKNESPRNSVLRR